MTLKLGLNLLVYGENASYEYGGYEVEDTYSARNQLESGVAQSVDPEELMKNTNVSKKDIELFNAPSKEELQKLDPIYLSYFFPWSSINNYEFAKTRGFHDLKNEWRRSQHYEDIDQIDSRAYLVHPWLKYPKFGHAFATDFVSRLVREGKMSREEAIEQVRIHDPYLDPLCVRDFCEFCGYSEKEFWDIVDKQYNKDLFEKVNGKWKLKHPVWEN